MLRWDCPCSIDQWKQIPIRHWKRISKIETWADIVVISLIISFVEGLPTCNAQPSGQCPTQPELHHTLDFHQDLPILQCRGIVPLEHQTHQWFAAREKTVELEAHWKTWANANEQLSNVALSDSLQNNAPTNLQIFLQDPSWLLSKQLLLLRTAIF